MSSNKYLLCLAEIARRRHEVDRRSAMIDDLFETNNEVETLEILIGDYPLNRTGLLKALDDHLLRHQMTDSEFTRKYTLQFAVLKRIRSGTDPVIKAKTYRRFFVHMFGAAVVHK